MDYDPKAQAARAAHRASLMNGIQFAEHPAENRFDFNGQMRQYRETNPDHRGVMDYHETGNRGFMAHVEGVLHHAGSIDNWSDPLIDHHGRYSEVYQEKHADNERKPASYKRALSDAMRDGTADPIHLSMGHHMQGDSHYGRGVSRYADNREMLGNGNHRVVQANEEGIKRIPAKFTSRGTGEGYEATTQAGYTHPSEEDAGSAPSHYGPKGTYHRGDTGHSPAPLRDEQFSPVKPALNTEGQGMYAGMLRAYGKNTAQINQIGAGFGHAPVKGAGDMNTNELKGMRLALDAHKAD